MDTVTESGMSSPVSLPGSRVDRHFEPLHRLVQAQDNRPPPVDKLISLLSELYGQLLAIDGAYGGAPGLGMADSSGLLNTLRKLQFEGAKQPEPVKRWTQQLATNTQIASIGNARERLNALWQSTLRLECERALGTRYPFYKGGRFDVSIDDFGRFFAPGDIDATC